MLCYLFCLVTVITSVFTEDVHVPKNGSSPVNAIRIAGGKEQEGNYGFGYQVQISIEKMRFCSGAIFNERYILTAAHCVQNVDPSDLEVRAGSLILGEGTMIPISEIHIHPNYDEPINNFDIAYLKSTTDIPLSQKIRTVYFAPNFGKPDRLKIGGWGSDGFHGDKLSDRLNYVELNVINNMECEVYYPDIGITKNMVCAQNTDEQAQGACMGDGGSPATVKTSRRLYGISSFTKGCGPGMAPSVFTYVETKDILRFIINGTTINKRSGSLRNFDDDDHYDDY